MVKEKQIFTLVMNQRNFIGTPAYAAPEQWSSEFGEIGKETDVYSFGVLLFEMLAEGRRPFENIRRIQEC